MGRLCAAALMDHCKDCDGAFNTGGYLRSSITYTAGTNVTFNDILNVFPFQNTISTFRMQGKWFLDVLEHSVSGYDPTDGDGKFFGAVAGLGSSFFCSFSLLVLVLKDAFLLANAGLGSSFSWTKGFSVSFSLLALALMDAFLFANAWVS